MTDKPRIISAVADVRFTRMMKPGKLKRRAFIKTVKCFCWNPNYTTPTPFMQLAIAHDFFDMSDKAMEKANQEYARRIQKSIEELDTSEEE